MLSRPRNPRPWPAVALAISCHSSRQSFTTRIGNSLPSDRRSFFDPSTPRRGPRCAPSHILPLKPSVVYDTYWKFAAERQEVFFRRLAGGRGPWTSDPVLNEFKFTNAYRASDRVSQYLIRHVI